MERELEVKLLDIDVENLEKTLIEKKAKLIAKEFQKNITINSLKNPINNEEDGYLRIRKTKNLLNDKESLYFTFKENISNNELRENIEHTIKFDSEEELINILKLMSFDEYDTGYKNRVSYLYKNVRIDIDTWDENTYPYPYAEVEVESTKDLNKFLKEFKIDKEHVSKLSIKELKNNLKK